MSCIPEAFRTLSIEAPHMNIFVFLLFCSSNHVYIDHCGLTIWRRGSINVQVCHLFGYYDTKKVFTATPNRDQTRGTSGLTLQQDYRRTGQS